jgi:hypothetical protein
MAMHVIPLPASARGKYTTSRLKFTSKIGLFDAIDEDLARNLVHFVPG